LPNTPGAYVTFIKCLLPFQDKDCFKNTLLVLKKARAQNEALALRIYAYNSILIL